MVDMNNYIVGGVAALGALSYCFWYFLKAMDAARKTPAIERVDWLKVTMTVLPSLVAGFLAGYKLDMTAWSVIPSLLAGWAAADIGNELGVDDLIGRYFTAK